MSTREKIMRLLGQSATNATPREDLDASQLDSQKLRARPPQNLAFCVGKEISCLDKSPDGLRVVIAGPGVFKILKVEDSSITEDIDLKAIIWIHATSRSSNVINPEPSTNLNIVAVKWLHGGLNKVIIAASTNGVITAYDISQIGEGIEIARVKAHARDIYKLAVSPHKPQWLLSASRDGTVKSWNIRSPGEDSNVPYFRQWRTFKCTSEVLDVEWSPTDGFIFACCTDLGQILKWDLRDPMKPILRINAHYGQCSSISWHPNGEHVTTGGQDQFCFVWNLSKNAKKNQKALHILETKAPISIVSWRPVIHSSSVNGKRAAQIIIVYRDDRKMEALVEIWDLSRPTMPIKQLPYNPRPPREMINAFTVQQKPELKGLEDTLEDKPPSDEGWDTAPNGLVWKNPNILWTINNTIGTTKQGNSTMREGWFIQSDMIFIPRLIDRRSLSNFSFSTAGKILMILEQRSIVRRRRSSAMVSDGFPEHYCHESSKMCVSPSDSEEDVVSSVLGSKQEKKKLRRMSSSRSAQLNPVSPSNIRIDGGKTTPEESNKVIGSYQSQQVMAVGNFPTALSTLDYQHFSSQYLMRLLKYDSSNVLPHERISSILEDYGCIAEILGYYRLAQTWRLLGTSIGLLLTRRAEYHRDSRLKYQQLRSDYSSFTPTQFNLQPDDSKESNQRTSAQRHLENEVYDIFEKKGFEKKEFTPEFVVSQARLSKNGDSSRETGVLPCISAMGNDALKSSETTGLVDHNVAQIPVFNPLKADGNNGGPELRSYNIDYTSTSLVPPSRVGSEIVQEKSNFKDFDPVEHSYCHSTSNGQIVKELSKSNDGFLQPQYHDETDNLDQNSSSSLGHNSSLGARQAHEESGLQPALRKIIDPQLPSVDIKYQAPANEVDRSTPIGLHLFTQQPPMGAKVDKNPSFVHSDFLHVPSDPLFTHPIIDPIDFIKELVTYNTTTTSTPIHLIPIILLLLPFLPSNTIDPLHASQIMSHFHSRLNSLELYIEAAILRNLCVPDYPEVYTTFHENIRVSPFCTACNKPFDPISRMQNSHWKCPRCQEFMAPCPICEQREYLASDLDTCETYKGSHDFDTPDVRPLRTWWYCPGCAHGGHVACMQEWHATLDPDNYPDSFYSNGGCPVVGCLHACLAGSWRDELACERKFSRERERNATVSDSLFTGGTRLTSGGSGSTVVRSRRDTIHNFAVGDMGAPPAAAIEEAFLHGVERERVDLID
ncbi:WD repeat protein [Blumeria hordei DH14]|uniref:WD repeat protein n=1 Tax=Blumeria graminis f. sp. hordei (strain DH14) TaxID=546991 RepID=N1J5L3_BLUG1|nr:WD repeat protein [Blumeria hordei DH14]